MKTRLLAVVTLLVGVLMMSAAPLPAAAQTAPRKTSPNPKVGDQIGDWTYRCAKFSKNATVCGLFQRIAQHGNKHEEVGVSIRPIDKGGKRLAMVVTVPLGTFLGTGVAGKVDNNAQFSFGLQSCSVQGCDAAIEISRKLLDELKRGKKLFVGFKKHAGPETTIVPVSLNGFDKGVEIILK